jgi:hypothetical protein
MGCPPTLALFGRETTEEERGEYRAQVEAYLKEPRPDPLDGYPTMKAALEARDAFATKYPLLKGCIDVILGYDPTREKRLRERALLRRLTEIGERYPVLTPEPEATEFRALLAELDPLQDELDADAVRRRLSAIISRENEATPAIRAAYEAAFGVERAPEMYWAMLKGC